MLGWLVNQHAIEPHIPVFDKSARDDGTFSREDFAYDLEHDLYVCPSGKVLSSTGTLVNDGATLLYRASKHDCDACELKPRCCPKMPARKVPRSIHEQARDVARDIAKTDAYVKSRRERKKIEMLFAHLKRILRLDRLRLRGPFWCSGRVPPGGHRPEPPKAGKAYPATRFEARLSTRQARARLSLRSMPTISSPTSSTQSTRSGQPHTHALPVRWFKLVQSPRVERRPVK